MATVAVNAANDRVAVATIATDAGTWGNDGGGGGVADEPDIVYQGASAQSRKVSTSLIGREYSGGTVRVADNSSNYNTFLFKLNCTNYSALNTRTTPGTQLKVGSSASDYKSYYVFGSDNYPIAGGWQFVPVNLNVTGYSTAVGDTGTPSLTGIDYYSWLGDYTATAKAENHCIDAIDLGRGLALQGGDGASTDGVFDDFVTADEGTSNNRWGYVRTLDGIMFCNGELCIGEDGAASPSAVATVFQDATGQVLVWENGLVATGYHRFKINISNATTDVDITGATFDSIGQKNNDGDRGYTTTEDSRLVVEVTGTSGDAKFIGCTIKNAQDIILTSATTLDTCDVQTESMTQSGAEIFDGVIRTTSVADAYVLQNPTWGETTDIRNTEFIQEGAGHAVQVTGNTQTITLTNITWTGYGADDTSSSAIEFTGTGPHTVNWSGGNAPTIQDNGSTVNVNNTVTLTITVKDSSDESAINGAKVRIEDTSGTLISNGTTNASGVYSDATYNYVSDTAVRVIVRLSSTGTRYFPSVQTGTITGNGLSNEIFLTQDTIAAYLAPSSEIAKLGLTATDPGTDYQHSMRVRARKVVNSDISILTVDLRESGTLIESFQVAPTTSWATYEHTFASTNISGISNYGNLEAWLQYEFSGDPSDNYVSWVELGLPS